MTMKMTNYLLAKIYKRYPVKQYCSRRKILLYEKYLSLLSSPINQHIMIIILLILLQNYLISKGLLETGDDVIFDDARYQAFMSRQIDSQAEIVKDYIQRCTDKQELQRIQQLVGSLIKDNTATEKVVGEEVSIEPTADWKESLLLFVGLSLGMIALCYSKDLLFSFMHVVIDVSALQVNILHQIDILLQVNPEQISVVFDAIDFSSTT